MVQNIFLNKFAKVKNANMFIFDAYGEYKNAFSSINTIDPEYNYKFITTNPKEATDVPLKIPVNLLKLDESIEDLVNTELESFLYFSSSFLFEVINPFLFWVF